jgi:predicted dehydrogenase
MPKRKINVALVGCGYIAENVHLPLLTNHKYARVMAVCDKNKERAVSIANKFGIAKAYDDFEDMLEKCNAIDIIDICTPPQTHGELIKKSLKRGYPCMVEKPFTLTTKEAEEVIDLSRKTGLKVYVIHNYSFVPCMRKAKSIVLKGKLGRIKLVETSYFTDIRKERYYDAKHWTHELPAGILSTEITPHLIMLLLDFLDEIVEAKVLLAKSNLNPHMSADELKMIMASKDGAIGHLSLSYNSPMIFHTLNIFGDRGLLSIDFLTQTTVFHKIPSDISITDRISKSKFIRSRWAVEDVVWRLTSLLNVSIRVAFGRYRMLAEGHRFLFQRCFEDLNGTSHYPVDINKCYEVVRLLNVIYARAKGAIGATYDYYL